MKTIEKQCAHCSKSFTALLKEHNRGFAKFCSKKCSTDHRSGTKTVEHKPNVTCSFCGIEFYKRKNHLSNSRSGLFFCCRAHKDAAQRIGGIREIMPDHYGETSKSYRKIALRVYPNECSKCGYDKHVSVLEVHHIDENRLNNAVENLRILCPTCHVETHLGLD